MAERSLSLISSGTDLRRAHWFFVLLALATLLAFTQTHPMMHIGFDIWHHLDQIDVLVQNPQAEVLRPTWYQFWAWVFRTTGVESVFARARIIHVTQTLLTLVMVFASARIILRCTLPAPVGLVQAMAHRLELNYLAYGSVVIWLISCATFSIYQHHVWLVWYSVNYQITLPAYLLLCAMSVSLIVEPNTRVLLIAKSLLVLGLVLFVLKVHAAELIYFVWILIITFLVFGGYWLRGGRWKWLLVALVIGLLGIYVVSIFYHDRIPELISLIGQGKFSEIATKLDSYGQQQIEGMNRRSSGWNEIFTASILILPGVLVLALRQRSGVNVRMVVWIGLASLLIFIPIWKWTAGLAAMLSYTSIVSRHYFSSMVFLVIPLACYLLLVGVKRHRLWWLNAMMVLVLAVGWGVSKSKPEPGNLAKNVHSLRSAFMPSRMDINVSPEAIALVDQRVRSAEAQYGAKNVLFYTRPDLGYIVKYVLKRPNIYFDRRDPMNLEGFYAEAKKQGKQAVIIDDAGIAPSEQVKAFSFMSQAALPR